MQGKHLIVDVINIVNYDLLKTIKGIEPMMMRIINELKLNVVGDIKHQFKPYGATLLYLLAESHLSIHTYVDERYVAIDLYCCNEDVDFDKALDIIYKYFDGACIIRKNIMYR
jgi:S-adenosylmethionine decarboxylase proenzyme